MKKNNAGEWRSGFPRGIAVNPKFFAERGGLGIELATASSVGYYDREYALPGKPGEGCRFTGSAKSDYGAMYNDAMLIVSWLGADGTIVCPFAAKKSVKVFLISLTVIGAYFF